MSSNKEYREKLRLYKIILDLSFMMDTVQKFYKKYENDINNFKEMNKYLLYDLLDDEEDKDEQKLMGIKNTPCYVYYLLICEKDKIKIGISNNPDNRARGIQTGTGESITIYNTIKCISRSEAYEIEQFLHKEFNEYRIKIDGISKSSEWFDAKILDNLMKNYTTKEQILEMKENHFKQMQDEMNKLNIIL